jgi:hypothetical protein
MRGSVSVSGSFTLAAISSVVVVNYLLWITVALAPLLPCAYPISSSLQTMYTSIIL